MEDISRATGSVAHFYRTLKMGPAGSQATVEVSGHVESFKSIIDEVGSVQSRGAPIAASQPPVPAPQPQARA